MKQIEGAKMEGLKLPTIYLVPEAFFAKNKKNALLNYDNQPKPTQSCFEIICNEKVEGILANPKNVLWCEEELSEFC